MCRGNIPIRKSASMKIWDYVEDFDGSSCYQGKVFVTSEGSELCESCSRRHQNLEIFHIHTIQSNMKNRCEECRQKICTERSVLECIPCGLEVTRLTILLQEEKRKIKLLQQERRQRRPATIPEPRNTETGQRTNNTGTEAQ